MKSSSEAQQAEVRTRLMRARRRLKLRIPDWVYSVVTILVLLYLWQFAVDQGWLDIHRFPPPTKLAKTFKTLLDRGFPRGITADVHIKATLSRILQGYLAATMLAIPLGLIIGMSSLLERSMMPVITFARSVATISLLPLAVAWFGVGEFARVFLIAYGCFWIILTNAVEAVRSIDRQYVFAARSLGASPRQIFFQVMLPGSMPRIFSGMRVALGMGFLVIVAAEMIGTIKGLGALIMEARTFYRTDITMVGMLFIAIIGFTLTKTLGRLERILLPWVSDLEEVER